MKPLYYHPWDGGDILPLMTAPPKFSGRSKHWPDFQKGWEGYIAAYLDRTDNRTLIEILRNSLDQAGVDQLDARLYVEPNLEYIPFW